MRAERGRKKKIEVDLSESVGGEGSLQTRRRSVLRAAAAAKVSASFSAAAAIGEVRAFTLCVHSEGRYIWCVYRQILQGQQQQN